MHTLHLSRALLAFSLTCGLAAAQDSGNWSVSSGDTSDPVAGPVSSACTYRVHVNTGGGTVKVIVRDANGNKVANSSGDVEAGDSRDFDLQQGWKIEVTYVSATSTGRYEKL